MTDVTISHDEIREISNEMGWTRDDVESFFRLAGATTTSGSFVIPRCKRCGTSGSTHHPLCARPDGTSPSVSDEALRTVIEWMHEHALEVHQGIPA